MNILVTGGAGYLGSVLSRLLLEHDHNVRVLDNLMYGGAALQSLLDCKAFELIEGDVRDPQVVSESMQGIDAVVHLAALVGDPLCARSPELARQVNLTGSTNVLEAARSAGVSRFVFASTCSNYGRMPDNCGAVDETFELQPLSLYAETKVAVEKLALAPASSGPCITVMRFATLYGLSPRMRFDLTVNEFVLNLLTDRRLVVYGETFWRPYVHVFDAARAIELVLSADTSTVNRNVFNVGDTNENYRKMDLVEIIQKRVGPSQIDYVTKAEDPRDYRVSFERIQRELGYHITRQVPDGVDEIASALENRTLQFDKRLMSNLASIASA
jgi:nucleoside-diphosphate-sugar epimerase